MKRLIPLALTLILILIPILSGCGGSGGGKDRYTLTIMVDNGPGCSVTPASGTSYPEGTVVDLNFVCAAGYGLDHWGGSDGASVTSDNKIVMNGNKIIVAVFAKLKYDLEVDTDGNGGVAVSLVPESRDTYAIEHGQTVSLIAQPNPGYVFASWSGGLTGGANPATLTMTGPLTGTGKVTAHFARNLLHGHVVGKNSLQGMAGVTVTVGGQTTITDTDGYWEIRGVTYPATVTASVAPESVYLCAWFSPASVTVDDGESDVRVSMTAYVFDRMWGTEGNEPGQFEQPRGIAVDAIGHVYVLDTENHRIQRFDESGVFQTLLGGPDFILNGQLVFVIPMGLAMAPDGSSGYVLDYGFSGFKQISGDPLGLERISNVLRDDGFSFSMVGGVALGPNHHIYIADITGRRVCILDYPADTAVTSWRDFGTGPVSPGGIAIDGDGNLYVTDSGNNRVLKVSEYGSYLVEWGSSGDGDGQLDNPAAIGVNAGVVCVVDYNNHRIQLFTTGGTFLGQWGSEGSGAGKFNDLSGVAVDPEGNIFVVDRDNNCIQKFKRVN